MIGWKTPKKMTQWSTVKPAEDANMGELATASRRQGRVEIPQNGVSTEPDCVK